MNTSEQYKLYINDRGNFILGHREGYYTMLDAEPAAAEIAHFASRGMVDYMLEDYDDGFKPAAYLCKIDFAAMRAEDIADSMAEGYIRYMNTRRRHPGHITAALYNIGFYFETESAGEGYELRQIPTYYLPYLVNGDKSGLEDFSQLVAAIELDEEIEVVAYEYEPDFSGECACLCRRKG